MNGRMGRVVEITAPYAFVIRNEIFEPPTPGHILIRVLRVGICASDVRYWKSGPEMGCPPIRLGHEPVGVVVDVGRGVKGIATGQIVTGRIEPALADYVYAEQQDVVHVPDGIDPAVAIGEPIGCVVDAYQRVPPAVGAVTAVVGLGFMGLLMTRLLALSPVAAIWAIGRGCESRNAASAAGATQVFGPEDLGLPLGKADLVVEATGVQLGLDLASNLATEHGALSILGYHQEADRVVDMRAWNWKCLTVINAHIRDRQRLARSTAAGLQLLASNRLDIAPFFTHQFELEKVDDAFNVLIVRPSNLVKVTIVLDGKTY